MNALQKMPAVISLGAGVSQLPLIERAKNAGYSVIAIDRDETAVGFSKADERVLVSTHDTDRVLEAVRSLQSRYHFDGVVARVGERALYTAAAVAQMLHLPGLTEGVVRLATEKSALREWCAAHQIRAPKGVRLTSRGTSVPLDLAYPMVVKPDMTINGKEGITVVKSRDDVSDAISAASSASDNGLIEIEEYITGSDVSCLFVVSAGDAKVVTYWDELVDVEKSGLIRGRGVSVPTKAPEPAQQRMENVAAAIAAAFPVAHALLIASFRIGQDTNPYLIELHADLGGDGIADMLLPQANPEFDYFGLALSVACDKELASSCPVFAPAVMKDGVVQML